MVLPAKPKQLSIAAFLSALMGPTAMGFHWLVQDQVAIPDHFRLSSLVLHLSSNFICAGIAIFAAKVIYRLGVAVSRERELGSYKLEERLGRGGMGDVWRARHRMLVRPAAIKLVRGDQLRKFDSQATILARFEREAQATAALRSPHTVDLFDFGVSEDETFYYVMELLEGLDMNTLIKRFGPLPAERVVFLLRQACHSLSDAHAHGMVHRDIKPANIFVCRYGQDHDFVKVLDFGLVRTKRNFEEAESHITAEGIVAGTPAFIAPELALGKRNSDGRADLYALGCVGYWLLTGLLVFEGSTPIELVVQHIGEEPIPPSLKSELEIPADLEKAILWTLQKDPAERPVSAEEWDQTLAKCECRRKWDQKQARSWWSQHVPQN